MNVRCTLFNTLSTAFWLADIADIAACTIPFLVVAKDPVSRRLTGSLVVAVVVTVVDDDVTATAAAAAAVAVVFTARCTSA